MTYCVGMVLDQGLVLMADTRTNSGVDNISVFRKMFHWSKPGDRLIAMVQPRDGREPKALFEVGCIGQIGSVEQLTERAISLNEVISRFASRDRQTFVFLDACRNNPLGQSGGAGNGLAQVEVGDPLFVQLIQLLQVAGGDFPLIIAPALVDAVAFQRLDRRLAAALLGHGNELATTHQQLADTLGTVREMVTRLLRRFERDGWIALSRERVRIVDGAALRRCASGL